MNIGLFVDVGNLYYCVGKAFPGRKLDYQKYLDSVAEIGEVTTANAYGTQLQNEAVTFIAALRHIGYDPRWKRESGDGRRVSWNVGIACDILGRLTIYDTVVIGSGDSNIVDLLHALHEHEMKTIIFASRIAREIKEVPGIEIREITEDLLEVRKS